MVRFLPFGSFCFVLFLTQEVAVTNSYALDTTFKRHRKFTIMPQNEVLSFFTIYINQIFCCGIYGTYGFMIE